MRLTCPPLVLVLLLWCAGLGAAGQFAKIAVPFGAVGAAYGGAPEVLGWLLSIISLAGALFGALAGAVVGRLNQSRLLVGALCVGGACSLWQSLLPDLPVFLLSRVIEGLSHLVIVIAAPTLIAGICPPRHLGLAMALWSTFMGLTFTLYALVGLPFVDGFGIGALLAGHGGYMLVMAAVLALVLPVSQGQGDRAAAGDLRLGPLLADLGTACRSPWIAAPGVGWLFYTLTFVALLAVLPERLPPEARAPVTAVMPLVGTGVALLVVPLLLRAQRASQLAITGYALAALVTLAWGHLPLAWVSVALFTVLGLVQGTGFASVSELNPSAGARAMGYGLMAQTGNIGNLAGTPLMVAVLARGGEPALKGLVVAIYLAALMALIWLARRRSRSAAMG